MSCWCGEAVQIKESDCLRFWDVQHGENPECQARFSRALMVAAMRIKVRREWLPAPVAEWFVCVHQHQGTATGADDAVTRLVALMMRGNPVKV